MVYVLQTASQILNQESLIASLIQTSQSTFENLIQTSKSAVEDVVVAVPLVVVGMLAFVMFVAFISFRVSHVRQQRAKFNAYRPVDLKANRHHVDPEPIVLGKAEPTVGICSTRHPTRPLEAPARPASGRFAQSGPSQPTRWRPTRYGSKGRSGCH
jgi:hypothetical protein